jgi:hypothetical protein
MVDALSGEEIRRRLSWGATPTSAGSAPPPALAASLCDLYSTLTGADPARNLAAPLELADASESAWHQALVDHAFTAVLSTSLARHEAALQDHGAAVLEFWHAARELCGWLAGLMHAARAADTTRSLESLRRDLFAINQEPVLKAWFADMAGTNPPAAPPSAWRDGLSPPATGGSARFVIGAASDGGARTADLSESQSPHVLVGGSSGSARSAWLKTCVASLLAVNTPATLRVAPLDGRQGTFGALADSPFLWKPESPADGAAALLERLVAEMERRLARLEALPRIVCVCDDYAAMLPPKKAARVAIEAHVTRIAAQGRPAGVNLVFATSRQGREVASGALGRLPARVALAVVRRAESRRLVGEAGAETLPPGELLYKDLGAPLRLKALTTTEADLAALAARQRGESAAV